MTSVFVRLKGEDYSDCDLVLEPSVNLFTGEDDLHEAFGPLTSLEVDLLLIGSAIFATDRAIERNEREDYQRRLEINIPVINTLRFADLKQNIEQILRILSNDAWRITFRQAIGKVENHNAYANSTGQVLLFSGGLDSLAAAINLSQADRSLQLVSHKTRNQQTSDAQLNLVKLLAQNRIVFPHHQIFVSSRSAGISESMDHDVEDSQRTRSFLFLILGALVARRTAHYEIVFLAENGQMAIHLPLTQGRIGAFSTHTAHPNFLAAMERFLIAALDVPIRISNPYVYQTKAEVIKELVANYSGLIEISQSCWRNSRLTAGATHCGECIPCFIRRIAIEFHLSEDPTPYSKNPWQKDILKLPTDNIGRRNLIDLVEFILKVERYTSEEMMSEWPELFSRHIDASQAIDMYKRFTSEARLVLTNYPKLRSLLE